MQGVINKIESMGLNDGPGIRTIIFFSGCKLRCKFCHNPEAWTKNGPTVSVEELVTKILRFKNYYGSDGGVTLSGGEPLLQIDFAIELCKNLKKHNISIALDTAGVGNGKYTELLDLVDIVLLDIKHINPKHYLELTGQSMDEFYKFVKILNKSNKDVFIRQVIVPSYNDNLEYIKSLALFLKQIKNIKKIELLPYHNMAISKYKSLNISYEWENIPNMDKEVCKNLENELIKFLNEKTD